MKSIIKIEPLFYCGIILSLLASCQSNSNSGGLSPAEALTSFELVDGFQIEQIASEPLVADPIAMEIDEKGRMYVLEMHGYPMDLSGSGVVKLLQDTDGDGQMDDSQVFADGLVLPNGIMRWKQGILVTDPPNLLYFEDEDNDGKADKRDTILTGFALTNPQHNFNTPIYGLDNWIYLGNESVYTAKVFPELFGGEGGDVHYPALQNGPVLPDDAAGRSVRLRPDRQLLENLSSDTQYGQTFDKWGRHLLVSNANHIYHEVMAAPYLNRNPDLLVSNATESVAEHGPAADVFPITKNPDHQLLTDLGVFTSACGITAYQGGLFPSDFDQTAFVAEPVSNLVHVDNLAEKGATFNASRKYKEKEFLASTDAWFRPVSIYTGPDGALYIIDYYRQIIEHPEWMADDVIESGALYNGTKQGRIYRVSPVGSSQMNWSNGLDLASMSSLELTELLGNSNIWYRKNAQRLLVDRQDGSVVEALQKMAISDTEPVARLHALWTLEGLDGLNVNVVMQALQDPIAGIRENAILLAEKYLGASSDLEGILTSMVSDNNARVRFQLLCTLGYLTSQEAKDARAQILFENISDSWIQIAALSAPSDQNIDLLSQVVKQYQSDNPAYFSFVDRLVSMMVSEDNQDLLFTWVRKSLIASVSEASSWQAAVLQGMVSGLQNKRGLRFDWSRDQKLLAETVFNDDQELGLRKNALALVRVASIEDAGYMDKARAVLVQPNSSEASKILAIEYLAMEADAKNTNLFKDRLVPTEAPGIQMATLKALSKVPDSGVGEYIIKIWKNLTPEIRDAAIDVLVVNDQRIKLLIEAMEAGIIDPAVVGWGRSVELMAQQEDESMRNRARALFTGSAIVSSRKDVIDQYQASLKIEGNVSNGKLVFEKNCAICHQIGGSSGVEFGPDLRTIKNRRPASILSDILDPNLSIADGYDNWRIQLVSGDNEQGIISSEAPNAITLRRSAGNEVVLQRSQISELTATATSMMPVGLENQISVNEMADLLSFIKNGK